MLSRGGLDGSAGRTAALWEEIFVSFTDMMDPYLCWEVSPQDSQGVTLALCSPGRWRKHTCLAREPGGWGG